MIKICIVGTGNLGQALIDSLPASIELAAVANRSGSILFNAVPLSSVKNLPPADVCILAVSDDHIAEVAADLPDHNWLVVHTSGSVSIDALPQIRRGVFYPLQTFSKNRKIDMQNVPIILETLIEKDQKILKNLADLFSKKSIFLNSNQRFRLHIAAVFASNFSNHMYTIAENICIKQNINISILHPLLLETAQKAIDIGSSAAQTGPAKRNDRTTVSKHIEALQEPEKTLYKMISNSIKEYDEAPI